MDEQKFVWMAKAFIADFYSELNEDIKADIYTVWLCKTLQNNKGMFSTTFDDGRYFEVTYNGDKDEFYFDSYEKELNKCIKI